MKITIQEAIKAMDDGKIVKCHESGWFYRKSNEEFHEEFFDVSQVQDFKVIFNCISAFMKKETLSDWEIVEQEEEPKPCLFCGKETHIAQFWIVCPSAIGGCGYWSPYYATKTEAIRKHNELYDKLNLEVKDSDFDLNIIKAFEAIDRGKIVECIHCGMLIKKIESSYFFYCDESDQWIVIDSVFIGQIRSKLEC